MRNRPLPRRKKADRWRDEVENDPRVTSYGEETERQLKTLEADKDFAYETERLKLALEKICEQSTEKKKQIHSFFKRFSGPLPKYNQSVQRHLESMNPEVRGLLSRYVRYSTRFGVSIRLKNGREWDLVHQPIVWKSFHMKIKKGQLQPLAEASEGDDYVDLFAAEELTILKKLPVLGDLVERGEAKVALIEDDGSPSLLSTIEGVTYSPAGLTFIVHMTTPPVLVLLVGEQVSTSAWRRAGRVVSSFQRLYQDRSRAGRPTDIAKLKEDFTKLRKPGTLKEKAISESGNAWNQQSKLSKTNRKLQQ